MKTKHAFFLLAIAVLMLTGVRFAHAETFATNLSYGMQNNSQVTELQEFLTAQGLYSGPITGNFYSLTLAAVKAFQTKENITPVSGYFGPITRAAANAMATNTISPSSPSNTNTESNIELEITTLLQQITSLEQNLQTQPSSTQTTTTSPTQTTSTLSQTTTTQSTTTSTQSTSGATFSISQIGPSTARFKSAADQLATVTFSPGTGSIVLNTLTITLSGSAIASSTSQENTFASNVYLLLNGTKYPATNADCTQNFGCAITWNFGTGINGFQVIASPITFTLIADDFDNTNIAQNNNAVSLEGTISSNTSVQFTDSTNPASAISNIGLPSSIITPLQIFNVQFVENS